MKRHPIQLYFTSQLVLSLSNHTHKKIFLQGKRATICIYTFFSQNVMAHQPTRQWICDQGSHHEDFPTRGRNPLKQAVDTSPRLAVPKGLALECTDPDASGGYMAKPHHARRTRPQRGEPFDANSRYVAGQGMPLGSASEGIRTFDVNSGYMAQTDHTRRNPSRGGSSSNLKN